MCRGIAGKILEYTTASILDSFENVDAENWLEAIYEGELESFLEASLAILRETEDVCIACNGSGEGAYDGALCRVCRGTGSEPRYVRKDEME